MDNGGGPRGKWQVAEQEAGDAPSSTKHSQIASHPRFAFSLFGLLTLSHNPTQSLFIYPLSLSPTATCHFCNICFEYYHHHKSLGLARRGLHRLGSAHTLSQYFYFNRILRLKCTLEYKFLPWC